MEGIRTVLIQKRKDQNISITQLSEKAGVSVYSIKKFESGEKIDIEKICKIAAGLGYKLESATLLPETLEKYEPYKLPLGVSTGDKHWKWTILGPAKRDKFKHSVVLCECDCENHTLRYVDWGRIAQNKSTSCGCDRKEKIAAAAYAKGSKPKYDGDNLAGQMFGDGNLLALNAPPRRNENRWEWLCQCQIHDIQPKYFRISKLKSGEIRGCGCHGGSKPKYPNSG